jgi:hypothetical protein
MVFWLAELGWLVAAVGAHFGLRALLLRQVAPDTRRLLAPTLERYQYRKSLLILSLLGLELLLSQLWAGQETLWAQLGVGICLLLGTAALYHLQHLLMPHIADAALLQSLLLAEMLLFVALAGWLSLPLLAYKLASPDAEAATALPGIVPHFLFT